MNTKTRPLPFLIALTVFVIYITQHTQSALSIEYGSYNIIVFTLAVLSAPVFDTRRVMGIRILNHKSRFSLDKNYLHHLLIDLGISHAETTSCIRTLTLLNVLLWAAMGYFNVSANIQIVLLSSTFIVFGIPCIIWFLKPHNQKQYAKFTVHNMRTHLAQKEIPMSNSILWAKYNT